MKNWASQFQQTSGRDPWLWPIVPRVVVYILTAIFVAVLLWFLWLSGFEEELEASRATEKTLRDDFSRDYKKAVNLESLLKQKEQAQEYVNLLEKQLPNEAEMAALLSDINQAGIGRGLQFDVFKPGAPQVKQYYAEQPIEIVVSGSYDAIAQFVSDIANLSRIVTIGDIDLNKAQSGSDSLSMRAAVKTYRYLSLEEQQQRAAQQKGQQRKR
ncbi:pilus assembly protein PilO [Lampropedia aestuarii]|uniref:Pilus assembly protein PilO n=1 Tax=Lampropedia aestuarii TaxID=2562762 RepID=A0A4S5BZL5_9BURK|nr:type 4a pilus biogenesis protein PilO [Lampropedia aestuarii]MDH5856964.1 type 4a pilus biogenesis protein PilO [Lampropedia aestuarii]THJ36535.1 pilus assembly protein PilO [Lampropedia aestuarii]